MNNFQKEFVMSFFMDSDSVSTVNRIAVAVTDVINENNDSLCCFNELTREEFGDELHIDLTDVGNKHTRLRYIDYYENEVQHFSEEDYEATFGMKKSTVQALTKVLTSLEKPGSIPLEKKVHIFLMFFMSDLTYNDVGKFFGIHKSSVSHIFHEIATYLSDNWHNFISWPSIEEQHETRIKVNSRFKIPNCVGFIDACHFHVGVKRKKHETVLLQAVCDESFMFIDIHIGQSGVTKKSKVYKQSSLSHELLNFVEYENHLIGDSEYKLHMNLITPFSSEEVLTNEEMKFNEIHWKARSYIHSAFELLKRKMCKLNHMENFNKEFVYKIITSACVLHNFIIIHEGNPAVKEESIICDDAVEINSEIVHTAVEKRQFLCNYINYIDSDSDTIPSR